MKANPLPQGEATSKLTISRRGDGTSNYPVGVGRIRVSLQQVFMVGQAFLPARLVRQTRMSAPLTPILTTFLPTRKS
jgi:hypothetical protein